tara:strand:- start:6906 stop:7808 length:903 start_codon:yes stop_codon:yes gene_type:complete
MTRFIDLSKKKPSTLAQIIATVLLVIFFYLLGGFGLHIDYVFNSSADSSGTIDLPEYISALGSNRVFFWLLFPFFIGFVVFLSAIKWIHRRPILSLFTKRSRFDWYRVWLSFLLVFIILSITTGIQIYFSEDMVWNLEWYRFIPLVVISFLMIPFQTTLEELLFRGYLMQGLKTKLGSNIFAVLLSGLFFGLMHAGNPEVEVIGFHVISYYIIIGIFLGCLVIFDNGLELSIGFHAANNIFAALIVSNDWQVFQTEALFLDYSAPEFSLSMLLISVSFLLLLVIIFRKIYRWKSLKEYWV